MWQKKSCNSNTTLRSTDNSGILQCFRGTTVCAASGGLDMHVPVPFLKTEHKTVIKQEKLFYDVYIGQLSLPCTWSHPSDWGAGWVVTIADRAWLIAKRRSAVCGTVRPSSSTSHSRHTHGSLFSAACQVFESLLILGPVYMIGYDQTPPI